VSPSPRLAGVLLIAGVMALAPAAGGAEPVVRRPLHPYAVLVHSELGMHITSFDFKYTAALPPFNSVQVQVVRTEGDDGTPAKLLTPADGVQPQFGFQSNSYSAGNKLAYWGIKFDVDRNGRRLDPLDQPPVEFVRPYYTYGTTDGVRPPKATAGERVYLWNTRAPDNDHGPTGQRIAGWPPILARDRALPYTGARGVRLFVDGENGSTDLPITLAPPNLWSAVGLPLTPYLDYSRGNKSLRSGQEVEYQPYQRVIITLNDAAGKPVADRDSTALTALGVIAVDAPACDRCHGSARANGERAKKWRDEAAYWLKTYGDATEHFAATEAAAISILELHDKNEHTHFTWDYDTRSAVNRLGRQTVLCPSCHADNAIGRFQMNDAPATNEADTKVRAKLSLTEALHRKHARAMPAPDAKGRPGNCQMCHPAHSDRGLFDRFPATRDGANRYAEGDNRDGLGSYTGRDLHSNPYRATELHAGSHLNAIGQWYRDTVWSEDGKDRGLYCTHCHNPLSNALYQADRLTDAATGGGAGLRSKTIPELAAALTGGNVQQLIDRYLDPKVVDGTDHNAATWDHGNGPPLGYQRGDGTVVAKAEPGATPIAYGDLSGSKDFWFSPGLPHCADCHAPPFVESMGGEFFPMDQPAKYSLMRFSHGHAQITCQGCHQSAHGLFPVNPLGNDAASPQQAAQYNADGSTGPVGCGACHRTTAAGVPLVARNLIYGGSPIGDDYDRAVAWAHADR